MARDASLVFALFIYLQPDLLSLVYLVKRKRAGDAEADHKIVCHTGIDVFMVFNSAIDYESAYSSGCSERRLRWLGISVLSLVSDFRIHDFFQRPTPAAYYESALDFSFTGRGFIDRIPAPVV